MSTKVGISKLCTSLCLSWRAHVIYMETRLPRIVLDRKGHTIDETLCIPTYILLLYVYLRLNYIHTKYIIKVPIIITN